MILSMLDHRAPKFENQKHPSHTNTAQSLIKRFSIHLTHPPMKSLNKATIVQKIPPNPHSSPIYLLMTPFTPPHPLSFRLDFAPKCCEMTTVA